MNRQIFLKILLIHFFALSLAQASSRDWAFQQTETDKARALTQKQSSSVIVAVVDTGLDIHHPILQSSLWTNSGESGVDSKGRNKSSNGIDDDGNGFIDDVHGWNFVTNSADVTDLHGHGTHISGIIQRAAPQVQLMTLKYYDSHLSNEKNVQNTIHAFQYAIQMKARMINYSGGGTGFNAEEERVLRQAEKNQILLVAAAGNDGLNTDQTKYYPADYDMENILSVTAMTLTKGLPTYANYGLNSVHLAAPGDQIFSTMPNGAFGEMSGTSQATAMVSGAAALLLSQNPELSPPKILIERLTGSAIFEKSLQGKTKNASMLNTLRALQMKSPFESAAGFVFENEADLDSGSFTVSSSSLDPRPTVRQGSLE